MDDFLKKYYKAKREYNDLTNIYKAFKKHYMSFPFHKKHEICALVPSLILKSNPKISKQELHNILYTLIESNKLMKVCRLHNPKDHHDFIDIVSSDVNFKLNTVYPVKDSDDGHAHYYSSYPKYLSTYYTFTPKVQRKLDKIKSDYKENTKHIERAVGELEQCRFKENSKLDKARLVFSKATKEQIKHDTDC